MYLYKHPFDASTPVWYDLLSLVKSILSVIKANKLSSSSHFREFFYLIFLQRKKSSADALKRAPRKREAPRFKIVRRFPRRSFAYVLFLTPRARSVLIELNGNNIIIIVTTMIVAINRRWDFRFVRQKIKNNDDNSNTRARDSWTITIPTPNVKNREYLARLFARYVGSRS